MCTILTVHCRRHPFLQSGWGQGEEFIAILNPKTWLKRARGGNCNEYIFTLFIEHLRQVEVCEIFSDL